MSMHVKKIDKYTVEAAPRNLGNIANYNSPANEEQLLADGWRRLVETPCPGWGYRATYAIRGDEVRQGWELLPLDDLKTEKAAELAAAAERETREAEHGFISPELATRDMQAVGAAALAENPDADTPDAACVKAIAAYRGTSLDDARARINGHMAIVGPLAGKIVGVYNGLLDRLTAAATPEDVAAIQWPDNFDALEPPASAN